MTFSCVKELHTHCINNMNRRLAITFLFWIGSTHTIYVLLLYLVLSCYSESTELQQPLCEQSTCVTSLIQLSESKLHCFV